MNKIKLSELLLNYVSVHPFICHFIHQSDHQSIYYLLLYHHSILSLIQPFIIHSFVLPYVLSHHWVPSRSSTTCRTKWPQVGSVPVQSGGVFRGRQARFGASVRDEEAITDLVQVGRVRYFSGLAHGRGKGCMCCGGM